MPEFFDFRTKRRIAAPDAAAEAAPVAEAATKADIAGMSDPISRDQVNDQIEKVELRLDAKLAQVGADVRVVGAKLDAMVSHMVEFRSEMREDVRSIKGWIIGSVIAIVGILAGAAWYTGSLLATSQGSIVSSFQTGLAARPGEHAPPPNIIINVPPAPAAPATPVAPAAPQQQQ